MAEAGNASTVFFTNGDTDQFINVEHLVGARGDDDITGNSSYNSFNGGDGNDTFRWSNGGDAYNGGNDSDTVDFSSLGASNYISVVLNTSSTVLE